MTKGELAEIEKNANAEVEVLEDQIGAIRERVFQSKKDYGAEHSPIKPGEVFSLRYGKGTRNYRMQWVVPDWGSGFEGQAVTIKKDGTDGDGKKIYTWDFREAVKVKTESRLTE